jgi:hypothetical protein
LIFTDKSQQRKKEKKWPLEIFDEFLGFAPQLSYQGVAW